MEDGKTTIRVSVALSKRLAKLGTINTPMELVIETMLRLSNAEIDIAKFHKELEETKALKEIKGQTEVECPGCKHKFVDDSQDDVINCVSCGQEIILSELDSNATE